MYSPIFSGKTDRRIPWTDPEPAAYASPGSFYKSERSAFLAELIRSRWSGSRQKVESSDYFPPTTSKQYKLYRVLLYNLYIVFPIYGISTCVPGHINVRGKWFHLAQTSAKDARTAQLRPQDVSKHVPTCADIFTSWLGRLTISKSAIPDRLEPGIQRRGLRKESSLRKIFLSGFIIQNRYYLFSTGTIQARYSCVYWFTRHTFTGI